MVNTRYMLHWIHMRVNGFGGYWVRLATGGDARHRGWQPVQKQAGRSCLRYDFQL